MGLMGAMAGAAFRCQPESISASKEVATLSIQWQNRAMIDCSSFAKEPVA